jgi:chromosome segregation ATPase
MDIQQALRLIEWLDEERRRDRTTISTLEERLGQQSEVIDGLSRRLNSLESDQSVIKADYIPTTSTNETLDQMRRDMRQMVEAVEAKRLNAEREQQRLNDLNREQILRLVRELDDKADRLARQTGEIPAFQMERDRVASTVSDIQLRLEDLNKRFEDPDRRIAYLEEQRRQDTRRLTETETQLLDMRKGIDAVRPKIALIEDLSLRNERRIQEIANTDRERREQIQQFIDQQTLMLQQRDQEVAGLMKRFEEHDRAMEQNIARFETWSEAYRSMRQIIEDFHRIGERLERRINEVAEMQRLSEDRFRQEWNDYRTDDQKRWKQYTLSNDEVWRRHDEDFEEFLKTMQAVQAELSPLHTSVNRLWQLERERVALYSERTQDLLKRFDVDTEPETNGHTTGNGGNGRNGGY